MIQNMIEAGGANNVEWIDCTTANGFTTNGDFKIAKIGEIAIVKGTFNLTNLTDTSYELLRFPVKYKPKSSGDLMVLPISAKVTSYLAIANLYFFNSDNALSIKLVNIDWYVYPNGNFTIQLFWECAK